MKIGLDVLPMDSNCDRMYKHKNDDVYQRMMSDKQWKYVYVSARKSITSIALVNPKLCFTYRQMYACFGIFKYCCNITLTQSGQLVLVMFTTFVSECEYVLKYLYTNTVTHNPGAHFYS